MEYEEIKKKLIGHKGQFTNIMFESVVPTLKSVENTVVIKRTTCTVTSGIEYKNRKEVLDSIADGTRGPVGPLPWGVWFDMPYGVTHNGNKYIRLYPPNQRQLDTFSFNAKAVFFANGKEIDRETAIALCGSKAQSRESVAQAITVNCASVVSIGHDGTPYLSNVDGQLEEIEELPNGQSLNFSGKAQA